MSNCAVCGKAIDGNPISLPTVPTKSICERCNYQKYLANSSDDPEKHVAYFERYIDQMDWDVLEALDGLAPALGLTRKRSKEAEKRDFANSLGEYYEYDIATVINEGHGTIDRQLMLKVISDHAGKGWRLHSVYSNELGKNAISLLGLGVNSTACEDVLIFERRIQSIE